MIIPAILEQTSEGFNERFSLIKTIPRLKRIQVDFCDGEFVDKTSLSIEQLPELDSKYEWEAHIMAKNPVDFEKYQDAGFTSVIVHYEAFESEALLEEALLEIAKLDMVPGLAVNPGTTVSVLRYFTDTISNFTILSVHPGMQGQPFLEQSFERVSQLRELAPDATIEVDGGVNKHNASALIAAGANNLAVGSALFETDDIKQNYKLIAAAIKV